MKSLLRLIPSCVGIVVPISLFFSGQMLYAQTAVIDSLTKSLARPGLPDSTHLYVLLKLSAVVVEHSPTKAEEYGRAAMRRATNLGSLRDLAQAYKYVGTSYLARSEYTKAFMLYDSSRQIAEQIGDEETLSAVWTNMGLVFEAQADYVRALDYALRSSRIDERIGKQENIANTMVNIGRLYFHQKEYTTAIDYYERAMAIFRRLKQMEPLSEPLCGIGRVHKDHREYTKAQLYFDSALAIQRAFNNQRMVGEITHDIASTYLLQGDFKKSYSYLQEALSIRQMLQNKSGIAQTLSAFGSFYLLQNNFGQAQAFYKKSLQIASEIGLRELQSKILAHLAMLAKQQGQYKRALEYQSQSFACKDSIFNNARSREIGRLEMVNRIEQREAENQLLLKDRALQSATQSRERILLLAVSLGLLLSFGIGLLLWRFGKRQQSANRQLRQQKDQLESQAHEIENINAELQKSNLQLLGANEQLQDAYTQILEQTDTLQMKNERLEQLDREKNEFLGIAAHDLKNPLATIRLTAELLDRFSSKIDVKEQHLRLRHIADTVDRMMRIITDLLSSNALESGAVSVNLIPISLETMIEQVKADYQSRAEMKLIQLHVVPRNQEHAIPPVLADATMLWNVLENLLSNAIKFSLPNTAVTLGLEVSNSVYRIRVQDEGPGISEEDSKKLFGKFTRLSARPTGGEHSTGLGLSIVKKMVEAMNGRVWCESEVGKGATFIVELPHSS